MPRLGLTDPQAAVVGATEARFSATVALKDLPRSATYTLAYEESNRYQTKGGRNDQR